MPIILKQSYIICTFDLNPLSFKQTRYVLPDRQLDSKMHMEYLIKAIDEITEASTTALEHALSLDEKQLWIRYKYDYEDQYDRQNWGGTSKIFYNPLYRTADPANVKDKVVNVDFSRKQLKGESTL